MSECRSRYLSRITGKLLGDGCITKQQGRKPRFQFIPPKGRFTMEQLLL